MSRVIPDSCPNGRAPGILWGPRRRRIGAACVAALVLPLIAPVARALELPLREVLIGGPFPIQYAGAWSGRGPLVEIEYGYWDLYRMRSAREQHDYHQGEATFAGIIRGGGSWIGLAGRINSLVVAQENVYTDADRLSGGSDRNGGRLIAGAELDRSVPYLHNETIRIQCSIGWEEGAAASAGLALAWGGGGRLAIHGETAATSIGLTEEINGYAFPFTFPFRTSGTGAEGELRIGPLHVQARGGYELSAGDHDRDDRFSSDVWCRRMCAGGSVLFRAHGWTGSDGALMKARRDSPVPGLAFRIDHHRISADIGMFDRGTRYLHLDDLGVYDTVAEIAVVPLERTWLFVGWERLHAAHAGDSFFDTWPFDLWDIFAARRYRLGPADERLDMLHIGMGSVFQRGRWLVAFEGRWEWWRDKGNLRWLEREDILFPFIFRYIAHDEILDIRARYAVQLEPAVSIRVSRSLSVRVSARAMVPFGGGGEAEGKTAPPSTPSDSGEKVTRHGGLAGRITLTYSP